jgi:hypothetical protein
VEHEHRSDAELIALAQTGWAPAFAVLLHRHGPSVHAVFADDADPLGGVIDTYVAAMRELHHGIPSGPIEAWLLDLAVSERGSQPLDPRGGRRRSVPLADEQLDEVWAELDLRWPDGRIPHHVPHWVGWTALVAALVGLGILVPYAVLTAGGSVEQPLEELQAYPVEAPVEEVDVEEPEGDELDGFDLPAVTFPDVEQTPAPEPGPAPAPEPQPEPAPEPAPLPEPEPEPEPEPLPEPEPQPEPVPEPEPEASGDTLAGEASG